MVETTTDVFAHGWTLVHFLALCLEQWFGDEKRKKLITPHHNNYTSCNSRRISIDHKNVHTMMIFFKPNSCCCSIVKILKRTKNEKEKPKVNIKTEYFLPFRMVRLRVYASILIYSTCEHDFFSSSHLSKNFCVKSIRRMHFFHRLFCSIQFGSMAMRWSSQLHVVRKLLAEATRAMNWHTF